MDGERSGNRVCQHCGAARDGGRFCSSCGLDFWRAAAGEPQPSTTQVPSVQPATPSAGPPVGLIAIAAGVLLLAVAGGLWFISGADLVPGNDPPALASRPPTQPILAAFFREAKAPDAAFAMEQAGTISLSGPVEESYDLSAHGRLHADDWISRLRIEGEDENVVIDVALVDGIPYIRQKGGDWVVGDALSGSEREPVNPFARISTVGELDYLGREQRDGVDGHLIATDKWLGASNADDLLRAIGGLTDREAHMEILVTDLGVPIVAEYTFRGEASSGGDKIVISGTTRFTFSDWENVEPIEPPVRSP